MNMCMQCQLVLKCSPIHIDPHPLRGVCLPLPDIDPTSPGESCCEFRWALEQGATSALLPQLEAVVRGNVPSRCRTHLGVVEHAIRMLAAGDETALDALVDWDSASVWLRHPDGDHIRMRVDVGGDSIWLIVHRCAELVTAELAADGCRHTDLPVPETLAALVGSRTAELWVIPLHYWDAHPSTRFECDPFNDSRDRIREVFEVQSRRAAARMALDALVPQHVYRVARWGDCEFGRPMAWTGRWRNHNHELEVEMARVGAIAWIPAEWIVHEWTEASTGMSPTDAGFV